MRIVAGKYRSIKLNTLDNEDTRPTLDMVKEAVFSSIGPSIIDSSFLDLFGGSGAIGLEALSRGATNVYINDNSKKANEVIQSNIDKLKCQINLSMLDYKSCLKYLDNQLVVFKYIYVDPPFSGIDYHELLNDISLSSIVDENTLIILEHDKKEAISNSINNFTVTKQANYGRIKIVYYRRCNYDKSNISRVI